MPRPKLPASALGAALVLLLLIAPLFGSSFIVKTLTEVLIFGIFAMSLDLLLGYTGLVSFGHAAFFGVGAYAAGYLAKELSPNTLVVLPLALLVVAAAALVIGLFTVRVSGVYFLMLTLAFSQMIYALADRWTAVTGGSNGLASIPRPQISIGHATLLFEDANAGYLLVLACFLLSYAAMRAIVRSHFGHVLIGIRENEPRLRAIGYNTARFKLTIFVVAGIFAGVAGTLYAGFNRFVSTSDVYWTVSGQVLIMVVIGGAGTLAGPVLGAALVLLMQNFVSSATERWPTIMGLVFILFVFAARRGLFGLLAQTRARIGSTVCRGQRDG
jgi:branched-chain amino acid transport system permease protein